MAFNKSYYFAIPVVLVILVLLFYLSPFSEVQYPQNCTYMNGDNNSNSGQGGGVCGSVITEKIPTLFPFKENPRAEWCRSIIPKVETACALKVDSAWLNDELIFSPDCIYFLNETGQENGTYFLVIPQDAFGGLRHNAEILSWYFSYEVQCPRLNESLSEP